MGNELNIKTICHTLDNCHVLVSTVKLAGYNFTEIQYETMVFLCDENGEVFNWNELTCERYLSEKEAFAGHRHISNYWRNRYLVPKEN